jgi:hypothetical protein
MCQFDSVRIDNQFNTNFEKVTHNGFSNEVNYERSLIFLTAKEGSCYPIYIKEEGESTKEAFGIATDVVCSSNVMLWESKHINESFEGVNNAVNANKGECAIIRYCIFANVKRSGNKGALEQFIQRSVLALIFIERKFFQKRQSFLIQLNSVQV